MTRGFVRRLDDVPPQPWKNGGGTTRELAAGNGWRISLASVVRDGGFSVFEGLTRHSVVVAGNGLVLRSSEQTIEMAPGRPVRYAGDVARTASLVGGPVQVLNVMVDARQWDATLEVEAAAGHMAFDLAVVLPIAGGCTVTADDDSWWVEVGECLLVYRGDAGAPVPSLRAVGDPSVEGGSLVLASVGRPPIGARPLLS
jgi:hypothetical protein